MLTHEQGKATQLGGEVVAGQGVGCTEEVLRAMIASQPLHRVSAWRTGTDLTVVRHRVVLIHCAGQKSGPGLSGCARLARRLHGYTDRALRLHVNPRKPGAACNPLDARLGCCPERM